MGSEFPIGAENMGGSSKFDGGGEGEGFESIHVGSIGGEGVKTEVKNTCEGVHLLVKLKNELLHTNFSMIL